MIRAGSVEIRCPFLFCMMLHPGVKMILWLTFAIVMQRWQINQLSIASLMLAIAIFPSRLFMLQGLLKRTGILMLSLFLVYGFTIPGQPLLPGLEGWSPTIQGIMDGSFQIWKLFLMLVSLAWVLGTTEREQFLYGIYWLFWPARFIGVNREQIAARIGLTLEYALNKSKVNKPWFERLKDGMSKDDVNQSAEVLLTMIPFRWQDGFLLVTGIAFLIWVSR